MALDSPSPAPEPYVPGLSALEIDTSVHAGFPSPAEDFQGERIDVLISHSEVPTEPEPIRGAAAWAVERIRGRMFPAPIPAAF